MRKNGLRREKRLAVDPDPRPTRNVEIARAGYRAAALARGRSEATLRTVGFDVAKLESFMLERRCPDLSKLNSRMISGFPVWLKKQRTKQGKLLSPATRGRIVANLRSFLKWAYRAGFTLSPLSSYVPLPRLPKPLPKDVPSLQELGTLLRYLKAKGRRLDAAILATLFACGLRRQELIDLKPDDFDAKESEVRVKAGKGGKGRTVPIVAWAATLLKEYIAHDRPLESQADRLFLDSNAKPLTGDQVGKRVKKSCRDARLKTVFAPHTLRHAFCIYLLRGGAGLRVVNELAGHAKLSATARYTRLTPSDLQAAVRKSHPRS